ncbi:hypothetical protein [Fodinibius halophilus]|uniref:DUF3822 family protein n=1 Tax=Fodinibius halophilus TaxID=1736908 RepID=A0A6M1T3K6_9BACT|nr:hypothetical protein [Fodinibius halophilus]NGP88659.1 hypothetical protein [Fodinibius halophilus]
MKDQYPSLGLCFFGKRLYYAVNDPSEPQKLARIGSYDFNIDVTETLLGNTEQHFRGIKETVTQLKKEYDIQRLRVLSFPTQECWTTVPKIVYDNSDEREKHISILMSGVERKKIHPTWYNLSNQDYKFLLLRNSDSMHLMQELASDTSTTDLISDFEIGTRWVRHANPGGSFMNICCFNNCISVSSFILGKLRGATFIAYDNIDDLPYLWLQRTKELSWMKGLHEEIYVYGPEAYHTIEILKPFWDEAGTVTKMDTLDKIQIEADEETYGFNLENAYPAMMLALDHT